MKINNLFVATVIFLFASIATSCSDGKIEFDRDTFDKEHSKWLAQGIEDYTFSYKYFSSATGPVSFTIVVRNGKMESVGGDKEYFNPPFTGISELFDDVASVYEKHKQGVDKNELKSVTIKIKYNTEYHYPQMISYSVGYKEEIDGGYYYDFEVTDFELLK